MRMGDQDRQAIPSISTGSLGSGHRRLASAASPKSRIVEIYGPESSGKTTLTLSVIAQAQKAGATCAFVDAEHAPGSGIRRQSWASTSSDLLVSQPDTGEQAPGNHRHAGAFQRGVDVIIVDSVAALGAVSRKSKVKWGDMHVGFSGWLLMFRRCYARSPVTIEERQLPGDLHQPDPHEELRDVWQALNKHRW